MACLMFDCICGNSWSNNGRNYPGDSAHSQVCLLCGDKARAEFDEEGDYDVGEADAERADECRDARRAVDHGP